MSKISKSVLYIGSILFILFILTISLASPITKYLIQKYDEKYIGRKIKLDWAYVNPFTGNIYFRNLKIYELKSNSIFFSCQGISLNITLTKLFTKTYELTHVTLTQPYANIIQNKNEFNLNDLLEKFSAKDTFQSSNATPHVNIFNIKINDGEFHYQEKSIPVSYYIKNVNLESDGKRWNSDTVAANYKFLSGLGSGIIKGKFTFNIKSQEYRTTTIIEQLDLAILEQYLMDLATYGSLSASLDAKIDATGNLNDKENITASGQITVNNFHFGKNSKDDYASFEKLIISMRELSPPNYTYRYDSITLIQPYLKYERYDKLDNFQNMFGKDGANIYNAKSDPTRFNLIIEIADYIKILTKNFFHSHYVIDHLTITKGTLEYNDYSLREKFGIELNPYSITADSIGTSSGFAKVDFKSKLNPYGYASVTLLVNPKDSGDFKVQYSLQKIPATLFNPYTITYTSFPLDRGTIEFKGNLSVKDKLVQSNNHLIIIDPRITKRIKAKDTKWIPMPLIMSFVRERGNVIDYEIPISGNLKDPKFHFRDVLLDLFKNIFVKPPTTPYRLQVHNVENEIEKTLSLKWPMRQSQLRPTQEKFIDKIADFLEENPEAMITVHPKQFTIKEREHILLFEAKKKYFLETIDKQNQLFNEADSESVDKMSIKDALFITYLNKQTNDSMLFTVQDKCSKLIDPGLINIKLKQLITERENSFMARFKEKEVTEQIKFTESKNDFPYNGFSFYKLEYNGTLPKDLIQAYHEMKELNEEEPRNKFKKERRKIINILW